LTDKNTFYDDIIPTACVSKLKDPPGLWPCRWIIIKLFFIFRRRTGLFL